MYKEEFKNNFWHEYLQIKYPKNKYIEYEIDIHPDLSAEDHLALALLIDWHKIIWQGRLGYN
jgi:hypothetical protein